MKTIVLAALTASLAAGGCATRDETTPKENYPDLKTGKAPTDGSLRIEGVHPANESAIGPDRKSGVAPVLFTVYDQNDQVITTSRSTAIDLAPGRYLIRLNDPDPKENAFWITVESGKTTNIDARDLGTADYKKVNVE